MLQEIISRPFISFSKSGKSNTMIVILLTVYSFGNKLV
jgi:hypothetical protein